VRIEEEALTCVVIVGIQDRGLPVPHVSAFYGVVIYMYWNERAALRHDEILANWERARRNEPLLGIDPLE
jgi:hypothetical protein